jgi:phosphatidylglycerophosphatase A
MEIKRRTLLFFVTCGFVGYLPFAPGTWGSAAACFFLYLFPFSSVLGNLTFLLVLVICAVVLINGLDFPGEDPGYIVIDEFAGMCVAMAGHKTSVANLIIGFILFRIFDIAKPYPIRSLERMRKGYGVVADDIAAGVCANLGLFVCLALREWVK